MKKLLLLSAVLLGAVSASQAGIHLNFGFGLPLPPLPLPPLPGIVIGRPAPAPYYQAPPVCAPAYVRPGIGYLRPPGCYDAPVVVSPPSFYFRFGPEGYRHYGWDRGYAHHGWERSRGWEHSRGGYYGHYR